MCCLYMCVRACECLCTVHVGMFVWSSGVHALAGSGATTEQFPCNVSDEWPTALPGQKPSLKSWVSLRDSNALRLEDAVWEQDSIYRLTSCRKPAKLKWTGIIIRHCHGSRKCWASRTRLWKTSAVVLHFCFEWCSCWCVLIKDLTHRWKTELTICFMTHALRGQLNYFLMFHNDLNSIKY